MASRGFSVGVAAALGAVLAFLSAGAGSAGAAFPGENGRIVYEGQRLMCDPRFCWDELRHDRDIFAVNPDGSGQTNLTNSPNTTDHSPDVSPDGSMIAFIRNGDVHVMGADGSGIRRLTGYLPREPGSNPYSYAETPAWSSDGERIVFVGHDEESGQTNGVSADIRVVGADGSGDARITRNGNEVVEKDPSFSPDGGTIVFSGASDLDRFGQKDIYVMSADGSEVRRLTASENYGGEGSSPEWSPDGKELAYTGSALMEYEHDPEQMAWYSGTLLMNADGSNKRYLMTNEGIAFSPDGEKVAIGGYDGIYVGNSDGDGEPTRITDAGEGGYSGGEEWDDNPDWGPACASCPEVPPPDEGDTADPTITRPKPAPGSEIGDRTPTIRAVVRDETSELAKADITLRVDGRTKGFSYDPETDRLSRATKKLSYGRHTVEVTATDAAGNAATERWSFRVVKRG